MPKILLGVSSSYCASFLKGQVSFLIQHGYEVIVISGPGQAIRTLIDKEGGRLYELDFSKRISPLADLVLLWKIVGILRKEKPDIVNAGNPKSGFLIMLACWFTAVRKKFFTMHGLLSDTQTGWKRLMVATTERISCRIAHKVIVVSPSLLRHAERRGILKPNKGVVVENGSCNGLDTEYFSKSENQTADTVQLRSGLQMKDHFTIGFVGRISVDKGINVLLDSFAVLKKVYPSLQMLIVGPTEEDTAGISGIKDRINGAEDVYHIGLVSDVRPAYRLMDVLVLPSLREGLGNVLLEAASMEIPVIASDIPGCGDALINGVTGMLVESRSVEALVNAIEKLIDNEALRHQYGMNGRKFVMDNFQQQKVWTGLLQLYQH